MDSDLVKSLLSLLSHVIPHLRQVRSLLRKWPANWIAAPASSALMNLDYRAEDH